MNSIQINIQANEEKQEMIISQLSELGAEGFEQMENELIAYFPENKFPSYDVERILNDVPHTTSFLPETNWNEVWESNFQPVIVDDFCAVRAHFHRPVENVEHEILITPKMSFGTGHHATTYMMMQQMREIDFQEKTVFDFGTGTGILAILAEKLGAASVTAIDVDDWSIENARENFERNNCQNIRVSLTSLLPADVHFDVILANINRNVIIAYMETLVGLVKGNGVVLFSGLLAADESDIRLVAENNGLQFVNSIERQGWISLRFQQG